MMKKIVFIIPSLKIGGSEKVISNIISNINQRKYEITLLMIKKEGDYLQFIPKEINIVDLNRNKARYAIWDIIKYIKQNNPDIVFTTLGYLNLLVSIVRPFLPKKIYFIARESSIVSENINTERFPILFKILYKLFLTILIKL